MDDAVRQSLLALADKYRVIARMRAEGAGIDVAHARAQMAALAARFPGALRELDELPEVVIASRLQALEASLAGGVAERWMLLQSSYHGLMRAALRIRRLLRDHQGSLGPGTLDALGYAAGDGGLPASRIGPPEVSAMLRPPGGRLNPWVFAQVAREHGVSADDVRAALFLR